MDRRFEGLEGGGDGIGTFKRYTTERVYEDINIGGMNTFLRFEEDLGLQFFYDEIEKINVGENFFGEIQKYKDKYSIEELNAIVFARKIATWGHQYFSNNDPLRHQIGAYLLAKQYGPYFAFFSTSGNEVIGLDIDLMNIMSRLEGKSGWAFQLQDFQNNIIGIKLAGQTK